MLDSFLGNQTPADHTASVNFTRSVSTDAVTGGKDVWCLVSRAKL
ncbi:hypothetical protein ABMB44_14810 [Levilactobacillus brevis]